MVVLLPGRIYFNCKLYYEFYSRIENSSSNFVSTTPNKSNNIPSTSSSSAAAYVNGSSSSALVVVWLEEEERKYMCSLELDLNCQDGLCDCNECCVIGLDRSVVYPKGSFVESDLDCKDSFGNTIFIKHILNDKENIASSIVLKIIDENNNVIKLPSETSVKEQVSHSVRCNLKLQVGCTIINPARINYNAFVVRTIPRNCIVNCFSQTSVTFDHEEDEDHHENVIFPIKHKNNNNNKSIELLRELVIWPTIYSKQIKQFGDLLRSPPGILLRGPPGTGKTRAVGLIFEEMSAINRNKTKLFNFGISGNNAKLVGGSEQQLRDVFEKANEYVSQSGKEDSCAIIFMDELDGLFPKRTNLESSRMVAQLLTLMDGVDTRDKRIIIIGATNCPDMIDPALRRPGRFEREIIFSPPNEEERLYVLRELLLLLSRDNKDFDCYPWLSSIAKACVGYVHADLEALCENVFRLKDGITKENFDLVMMEQSDNPASLLRSRASYQNRMIKHIGGYEQVKLEIEKAIEWPVVHKEAMERLGLEPPRGILLYGPPGCSKTTLARLTAQKSGFSFFKLSGADIYSPYVGDAEKTIRDLFSNARLALPAIVFLDEIDAIVGKRGMDSSSSSKNEDSTQNRILSTLLNELDGVQSGNGLLILGATNRIDMIDEALLRPGRFDRLVSVPLPNVIDRMEILKIHLSNIPFESESLKEKLIVQLGGKTEGKSGAELENICREAAMCALRNKRTYVVENDFSI